MGRLLNVQENPQSWNGINFPNYAGPAYTTSYGYDLLLDNLTSVSQTDPTSGTTLSRAFQYDSLKRLVRATNPELGPLTGNGSITYTYDDSGNLATRADPRVTTTFSAYDGMNRVTGKSYNDGTTPPVGYAYYPSNSGGGCPTLGQARLMSVTSGVMANNYLCYDVMGRVTSSSQKTGTVTYPPFSYTYDKSGALASLAYPSGRIVTNTFDVAGRINQVSGPANYASQVLYAPQGAIKSLTLLNGVAETWGFNTRQQPTSLLASLGATPLVNLTWGYGVDSSNNGNVMSHSITRGTAAALNQTYQYVDPSNRLSSALETNAPNGWWQAFVYDAFGNRAVPSGYDTLNPDQTPGLNEFTVNRWKRGAGDSYDGSGNQTGVATRANPGVSANLFTYDGENRMVTSNVSGMGVVTYAYDGEGRRVQKSSACSAGTCTTVFVYDAMGQLAAEYSTAPNPLSGTTEYLTADSLGSTRLVTDGSGAVTQCYDYFPFGEEIPQGINTRGSCYPASGVYPHTADATSRKFTGKERDVETGLDYFGARYFSAAQGRFTSPDKPFADQTPSDPQSWNLYVYGRNNPFRFIDPSGRCSQASGGYTDEGNSLFAGPCANGTIGDSENNQNSVNAAAFTVKNTGYGVEVYDNSNNQLIYESGLEHDYAVDFGVLGIVRGIGAAILGGAGASAAAESAVWSLGATTRGNIIEAMLGGNLPRMFPVIDRFVNGVATSIKSIDLRAATYQSPANLESRLMGYVDKLAGFSGGSIGKTVVSGAQITGRVLEVAVPEGAASGAQQAVLSRVTAQAAQQGVQVVIVPIR